MNRIGQMLGIVTLGTLGFTSCGCPTSGKYNQNIEYLRKSGTSADEFLKIQENAKNASAPIFPINASGNDARNARMEEIVDSIKIKRAYNAGKEFMLDSLTKAGKLIK